MCWHLSLAGIKISTIIWPGSANTEHYHLKLTETHSSLSFLSITPSYYLFLHIVVSFTNKFDEREQIEIVTHPDLYTHWQPEKPTQTQSCRNKQTRTHSNLDNHPNSFASQEKFLQELLALRSWWREKQNKKVSSCLCNESCFCHGCRLKLLMRSAVLLHIPLTNECLSYIHSVGR